MSSKSNNIITSSYGGSRVWTGHYTAIPTTEMTAPKQMKNGLKNAIHSIHAVFTVR